MREHAAARRLHPVGEVKPHQPSSQARPNETTGLRDRQEHWEEVFLFLEMWNEVARAWDNDTLLRLMRYARLEAETDRELEAGTSPCRREEPRARA